MSTHDKGKLYVFSGPSGAGKGTITRALLEEDNVDLSISMTTRAPREGEEEGKHYFFVSKEEFQSNIDAGKMLEWAKVYDNMYGTPKEAVLKKLDRGHDVILEIDIQGGLQVKKSMPETVLVFILPPSLAVLRERLEGRQTDSREVIEARLAEALNEIKLMGEYDYFIINDEIDKAIADTRSIMNAEKHRTPDKVKSIISRYEREKGE